MNKKLLLFGGILFCTIIFISAGIIFYRPSSPDRTVLKFAKEMNKQCPMMIDVETRLDNVNALADNTLHFDYTLIYHIKDSLPVENMKNYMQPIILNKIKTSETLTKFLDKKLTWVYSYKDKNGDFIFRLTYTPEQIKKPSIR